MLTSLRDVLGPCPKCVAKPASGNGTHRTYQHSRTYSKQSHYEVLGVERNASSKEIKSAFLKRSKMVHPDANLTDSTSGSHDKFVRLNEAYSVLSKPGSRREYDMSMASRWAMQRDLRHPVYHSHTAGGSTRPGSGFSNPEAEERVFWDETLFHQRDKSKDKFYEGKPYYGVNGVKKFPNSYIVFACVGLVFSGVLLHFVALHHSRKMNTRILDERDRRNNRNYLQSKENARVHGTALQLEILKSRVEEKHRSVFNPPSKD